MENINQITGHKVPTFLNQISIINYVLYLLLIDGTNEAVKVLYNFLQDRNLKNVARTLEEIKMYSVCLFCSVLILFYSKQNFINEDFIMLFIADLVVNFSKAMNVSNTITYGVGMACSYVEGYLVHVIPSDGHKYMGFHKNVEKYEQKHGVVFPVRKMFIAINKAMYCPPDLKEFNKENRDDLCSLEACQSLEEIVKDVAGVKDRKYSNSVYCIKRPDSRRVFVVAGTSSPLNTFYNVLKNKKLTDTLSPVNEEAIVEEFSSTLDSLIKNNPIYKDSCEIVFFDAQDKTQNLADILLKRIMELAPNFEDIRRDH